MNQLHLQDIRFVCAGCATAKEIVSAGFTTTAIVCASVLGWCANRGCERYCVCWCSGAGVFTAPAKAIVCASVLVAKSL